jgi:hypothetical protein
MPMWLMVLIYGVAAIVLVAAIRLVSRPDVTMNDEVMARTNADRRGLTLDTSDGVIRVIAPEGQWFRECSGPVFKTSSWAEARKWANDATLAPIAHTPATA